MHLWFKNYDARKCKPNPTSKTLMFSIDNWPVKKKLLQEELVQRGKVVGVL